MTTPDDRQTAPGDPVPGNAVPGDATPAPASDTTVPPPEQDDTPAWADADAFAADADAADALEAFAREQAGAGDEPEQAEPAPVQPTATEPAPTAPAPTEPIEPAPTEPAPGEPGPEPVEPRVPETAPVEVPFEAPAPEPLEAPGPEPLAEEPTSATRTEDAAAEAPDLAEPVHDSGSQVPGSALTGDQVAGERMVRPSAPPVLPHVPPPPAAEQPAPAGVAAAASEERPQPEPTEAEAVPVPVDDEEPEALADVVVVPAPAPYAGLAAAAVAVLTALALVLGVLAWRAAGPGAVQHDRDSALDAARSAARAVFSYDYRHLDKDFAAGKAVTTGEFRKEYERTTAKLVDDVAAKYKAVVVADVGAAGVVTASHGRVLVLVYVDQQSSSTLAAQPKLTQSRLEMTMVDHGGHWLVEKIRAF